MSDALNLEDEIHTDLPGGTTCAGWGICYDCCKTSGKRANTSCTRKSCWTGCTKIATVFVIKNYNCKWKVCTYCADRGACALNNCFDCLGKRYDIED